MSNKNYFFKYGYYKVLLYYGDGEYITHTEMVP